MDPELARLLFVIAAWLLGVIISLLVAYWVIRLAVTHSLRSHEYWKAKTFKPRTGPVPTIDR